MKRKFFTIAKNNNCEITEYNSYRSDMGCQVFSMLITFPDGIKKVYNDSYFVGSGDKDKVIDYFKNHFLIKRY